MKNGGINADNLAFAQNNLIHINSFEQFVMEWLNEETLNSYWHFIPQYKFITSERNRSKIMADFVGRFENLETDFNIISKRLGFHNLTLKKENVNNTNGKNYSVHYSKEMQLKVAELYLHDVNLLQYDF